MQDSKFDTLFGRYKVRVVRMRRREVKQKKKKKKKQNNITALVTTSK